MSLCVNFYNDIRDHDALGKRHCNSALNVSLINFFLVAWVIDSGPSFHVTSHNDFFTSFQG